MVDLTPRQIDVVRLVALGFGNKEIARHLHISERTVQTHLSNVAEKWGCYNRTQIAILALGRYIDLSVIQTQIQGSIAF